MLTGDNGLLNKAQDSAIKSAHAEVKEMMSLVYTEYQMEIKTADTNNQEEKISIASLKTIKVAEVGESGIDLTSFWNYVLSKGYIEEDGKINTQELLGHKIVTGNGEEDKDIYKLKEEEGQYTVYYYDENLSQEPMLIWNANAEEKEYTPTDPEIFEIDETATEVTITGFKSIYKSGYYGIKYGEEELTELIFPSEINGKKVTKIGDDLTGDRYFDNLGSHPGLKNVNFIFVPDSVIEIGDRAFKCCWDTKLIRLPSTLTKIRRRGILFL